MINKENITADNFLNSKELREQVKDKIEVLDKVKRLFLIPEPECMTVKQVADYFDVDIDTIKRQYQRNQDEFDSDGTCIKTLSDFQSLSGTKSSTLKMAQRRGFLEITLPDNTTLSIPNCGVKCYPKRAILRMGMLLRDSPVAKEIRTQLLNVFEHATTEQRVTEINEEKLLAGNILDAILDGNTTNAVASLSEYIGYKNRYISEIEQHNAELTQTNENLNSEVAQKDVLIDQAKPKTEFYDAVTKSRHQVDVGEFAKTVYKEFGKEWGRNDMYKWFRDNKYIRSNNEPYQQYVDAGYLVGKMVYVKIKGRPEPCPKLFITGKGQQYFLKKLREAFPKTKKN